MDVEERVKKVIGEQLGVPEEELSLSSSLTDDLEADSLDLVEVMMALEEEFSEPGGIVEITDEAAERVITIQDAVELVAKLQGKA